MCERCIVMKSRIENLGDYNVARIMLQEMDGNLPALIRKWKSKGALFGILIAIPAFFLGGYAAKKVEYDKQKKEKEESVALTDEEEPPLKKDEEPPC